ncbi:hypothetical protein Gotur_025168, partial [Gossypium turneri]
MSCWWTFRQSATKLSTESSNLADNSSKNAERAASPKTDMVELGQRNQKREMKKEREIEGKKWRW